MTRLLLLFRTLVWLKPIQIWWRVWMKVYRPRPRAVTGVGMAPAHGVWQPMPRSPTMTGPDRFRFLNEERAVHWTDPDAARLWLYNLHYFDDLVADGALDRRDWHRDLIARWIAEHPAPSSPGWEPYPTSLRIVNWVKGALAGGDLDASARDSLASQADWLSRRLEYHLLGNHLFANAKALVFAGCCLDGPEAARWLATGLGLLDREIPEQVLPDGGQFERSVMYHAIAVEDLLDLGQLAVLYPEKLGAHAANWRARTQAMLDWLAAMSHPDGRIAFFNDGAFGIAPEPGVLTAHARALGLAPPKPPAPGLLRLEPSGYARLAAGPAVVIADAAPIGPGYLPGHAHADTLSFELSLFGQRVFVNGGTSVYDADPARRAHERSTTAHNTVEVDGRNSSEVWASFRAARRATARVELAEPGPPVRLGARHDGFRRFGGPVHARRWDLTETSLTIEDALVGGVVTGTARFRLHPEIRIEGDTLLTPTPVRISATGGTLTVTDGDWAPEFGRIVPTKVLALCFDRNAALTLTWDG